MRQSTIGLIVPPAAGAVPADGPNLYGTRVRFIARGLGIPEISAQGFEGVIQKIVSLAVELRDAGAEVISLMGTSLSFYRGADFTDELRARMQQATGVPCTTMSHAIVSALQALGVVRVAVATSYVDDLNQRLKSYLESRDFEVTALRGLSILSVEAVGKVSARELIDLAQSVYQDDVQTDGLLISCGGLMTLDILSPLEKSLGVPVASSSPAGFWDVMRVAGLDSSAERYGRLFCTFPPAAGKT